MSTIITHDALRPDDDPALEVEDDWRDGTKTGPNPDQEACGEDEDREVVNKDFVVLGGVAGVRFSEGLGKLILEGGVPMGVVPVNGVTAGVPSVGNPVGLAVGPDVDFQGELCALGEGTAAITPLRPAGWSEC